jgi:hypothetical protein
MNSSVMASSIQNMFRKLNRDDPISSPHGESIHSVPSPTLVLEFGPNLPAHPNHDL